MDTKTVTTRAHTNIALIKYWGKKDEELKLPFQSSISFTLDKFYTDTKISFSNTNIDILTIDNLSATKKEYTRLVKYLNKFRELYNIDKHFVINSVNYVPKKAGLASSASAFASIALGLSVINNLNLNKRELSSLARLGSGSASRSIYEGFVKWEKGQSHETSFASKLNIDYKDYVMAVVILSDKEKKISSSDAMLKSTKIPFYEQYLKQANVDYNEMLINLEKNNFNMVGTIMQKNSDLLHKTINKTGINYYIDKTYDIIYKIIKLQEKHPFYYTIDAGANVKILTKTKYINILLKELEEYHVVVSKGGQGAHVKSID